MMSTPPRRDFRWWCPACRRTGTLPIFLRTEPPAWFLAAYARDCHAFEFMADREDAEPVCDGAALEIAEIFPELDAILAEANAVGVRQPQGPVGSSASSVIAPPAPFFQRP